MKRFNKIESPIFVLVCVLCFQRQRFRILLLSCFTDCERGSPCEPNNHFVSLTSFDPEIKDLIPVKSI